MNDSFTPNPPISVIANAEAIDQLKAKVDANLPDKPALKASPVARWFYYASGACAVLAWMLTAIQQFLAAFELMLPDKYKPMIVAFAGFLTGVHMSVYMLCDWYDDGQINNSVK